MYYLWICLWFYDGKLVSPASVEDIKPFLWRMWGHVAKDASPNAYAWKVYSGNFFFQLFIAWVLPGYQQEGLPVPSLNYKTLMYNCNALICLYTTLVTAAALHYYNIFRLTEIIDNYGHLMSVSMIFGFGVSLITYLYAVLTGTKSAFRIPWVIVFFLSVSGACKQYETYGYVTPNMAFMILATGFYINACAKGEECIPQTWDMFHEKWGFMVIFWNFSGVPFSYVYSVVYMASHDPETYRFTTAGYVFIYTVLCTAYYIWDTAMAQKSHFKMQTQGITKFRKTFPQLPGANRLLTSGWWAYSRKPNYVADWTMSLTWGAIIGTTTIIPYFYSMFFITVLLHRCTRDFERCSIKYGKDWDRYCEVVKYKYIPWVY
ncbi:ergosterol biosynthesis ERG4/ERG24 [Pholiota molesta]|nr:ergosterol biosynthesis ERG4/ERG24 [Pholiota molesta]